MDKLENAPVTTGALKRKREDLDILLPPPVDLSRHTLVLDMDRTLLAALSKMVPHDEGSEYFEITRTQDGEEIKKYVYKRPGLQQFLAEMSELFEVGVFTLSGKVRADRFLDVIDKNRELIKFRLYRDSGDNGVKDLSLLGRDLKKVIIIDDNPNSYKLQQSNGIPIKSFDGLKSDSELTHRIPFLRSLIEVEDVRPMISEKFHSHDPPVTDVPNAHDF